MPCSKPVMRMLCNNFQKSPHATIKHSIPEIYFLSICSTRTYQMHEHPTFPKQKKQPKLNFHLISISYRNHPLKKDQLSRSLNKTIQLRNHIQPHRYNHLITSCTILSPPCWVVHWPFNFYQGVK